jgi:hypothetical protein
MKKLVAVLHTFKIFIVYQFWLYASDISDNTDGFSHSVRIGPDKSRFTTATV